VAIDLSRFINRFVDEAREHLSTLGQGIASLESSPDESELIDTLFRSAHTIKGTSRMLKLGTITTTAHQLEDLLGALREGRLRCNSELARLIERAIDRLSALVDLVAAGEALPEPEPALGEALERAAAATATEEDDTVAAPSISAQPEDNSSTPGEREEGDGERATSPLQPVGAVGSEQVRVPMVRLDRLVRLMGELSGSHIRLEQDVREIGEELSRQSHGGEQTNQIESLRQRQLQLEQSLIGHQSMMGELNRLALELRMRPLATALEESARMVRELGRSLGKEVRCRVLGGAIELDRQMIARFGDSLIHLLRNAVDHGIESPAERLAAGKPAIGTITIEARQDGAAVLITISDDGAGLDHERIRQRAVERKLIAVEQAMRMGEEQLLDLIFLPGFSTSPIITDLSGRGVGMDVVRRTIVDLLHGVVSVDSTPGKGTRFQIRLPLSLAVMRILLCKSGGETVALSAQYVAELVRVAPESRIAVAGRDAFALHNEFVPLARLADLIGLPADPAEVHADGELVVVVRGRKGKWGLIVDRLSDERDMVIMPLPEHLAPLPLLSGMVADGDGRLVSLLHLPALIELARRQRGEQLPVRAEVAEPGVGSETPVWHILVVDDSRNTREIEKEVLEAHGYLVTLAHDGADGLRRAQQQPFDAVLTDVEMPRMDGFTLTSELRKLPSYAGTPIIIITSREKDADKRRGIEAGADAYIVKGDFDQGRLIGTLSSLLI
jgi:two-component system chemotaxis sensor kinase CheA